MATNFLAGINLNKTELQNAVIQNLASAPGTAKLGQIYFNTGDNRLYVCTNATGPVFADLGNMETAAEVMAKLNAGSAILDFDNLPTGTGAAQVAIGNHTHSTYAVKQVITASTQCKITYNVDGLITSGAALALTDLPSGTGFMVGAGSTPTFRVIAIADLPTITVAKGGSGLTTMALGTIPYASAPDTMSALAGPGAANYVLRSTGANAFAWGALVAADIPSLDAGKITTGTLACARGGTGLVAGTLTVGKIPYASGTDTLAALTGPTAGAQVLHSSAANTFAWAALVAADIPTLTLSKISDAGTAAGYAVGTTSGTIPVLGAGGLLPTSMMPPLVVNEVFTAANQAARLALTAERGDMCIQTDNSVTYVLATDVPSVDANWKQLASAAGVTSVNGHTGVAVVTAGDVGLGNVTNESKATMFTSPTFTGTPLLSASPAVGDNTLKVASTAAVVAQIAAYKYAADVGDGSSTSIVITHNLHTRDCDVVLRENSGSYNMVWTDVQYTSIDTVTLIFAVAPTAAQYRVIITA